MSDGQLVASSSSTLRLGAELKQELERAARDEGGIDGTALGRRIIAEWLAKRQQPK